MRSVRSLKLILEEHDRIRKDVVATARNLNDHASALTLLDFGWPVNHPLHFTANTADDIWHISQERWDQAVYGFVSTSGMVKRKALDGLWTFDAADSLLASRGE